MRKRLLALFCMVFGTAPLFAQLPPPPFPAENPPSEAKRVLGKLLFWDEQLSSDGTIACGTCHIAAAGGADPRVGIHPGPNLIAGNADDILGSPGVVAADDDGNPINDPIFGTDVQVTGRTSMPAINGAFLDEAFWDGRAGGEFIDPETATTSIAVGGALESQAVGPILSSVEMAHSGRTWDDVRLKLERSAPFDHATNVPADLQPVLAARPTYPELFDNAFGDDAITAERIAFAIASYERTLVADQTPWDLFMQGDGAALTPQQVQGWLFFDNSDCRVCHSPPTFSDNTFRNIVMRPVAEDRGRQDVTGVAADRGRFKVPSLRNGGLKQHYMHNGQVANLTEAILWYEPNNPQRVNDNLDPLLPVLVPPPELNAMVAFLSTGLTDPRVQAESFPFDRPELHRGESGVLEFVDETTLGWPEVNGAQGYNIYRGFLAN